MRRCWLTRKLRSTGLLSELSPGLIAMFILAVFARLVLSIRATSGTHALRWLLVAILLASRIEGLVISMSLWLFAPRVEASVVARRARIVVSRPLLLIFLIILLLLPPLLRWLLLTGSRLPSPSRSRLISRIILPVFLPWRLLTTSRTTSVLPLTSPRSRMLPIILGVVAVARDVGLFIALLVLRIFLSIARFFVRIPSPSAVVPVLHRRLLLSIAPTITSPRRLIRGTGIVCHVAAFVPLSTSTIVYFGGWSFLQLPNPLRARQKVRV